VEGAVVEEGSGVGDDFAGPDVDGPGVVSCVGPVLSVFKDVLCVGLVLSVFKDVLCVSSVISVIKDVLGGFWLVKDVLGGLEDILKVVEEDDSKCGTNVDLVVNEGG